MSAKLRAAVVACLVTFGCSDGTAPNLVQTADLTFVEQAAVAPELLRYQLKFYAVAGRSQQWEIHYADADSSDFLEFTVGSNTLIRDAQGNPLADGDSVEITIAVDSTLFIMRFLPEGLVFNPDDPARLEIEYAWADSTFLMEETAIRPWRQERAGDPWQELSPLRFDVDLDEIEVEVPGFTRYALAVN